METQTQTQSARIGRILPACAALFVLCCLFGLGSGAAAAPVGGAGAPAGVVVFVAGQVTLAGRAVQAQQPLRVGDEIRTGADGHVYIRSPDDGYLIVRPHSLARVLAWQVDAHNPAATRITVELTQGVARNVTGRAVQAARQGFRFNTPVAAIGVRGTDFTVFTDAQTTRVSVQRGAVVASPFGTACAPDGVGPCAGPASLELRAGQPGVLLQVDRTQLMPRLLPSNGNAPDQLAPPRPEEPARQASSSAAQATAADGGATDLNPQRSASVLAAASGALVPAPIHWGRWTALAGSAATLDIHAVLGAGGELAAINPWFAILRGAGPQWHKPTNATLGFALTGAEAWVLNEASQAARAAPIENARLQVDFAQASFSTGFDLLNDGQRHAFQAQGYVAPDGRLFGASQFVAPTNMAVGGVLGSEQGGSAAYLFQGRIDDQRLATGVTIWQRQP